MNKDAKGKINIFKLNGLGRKIRLCQVYHSENDKHDFDRNLCYVQEGQFENDELNGFGRKLFSNGHSFIGWV